MNDVAVIGANRTMWKNAGAFVKRKLAVLSVVLAPAAAFAQEAAPDTSEITSKIATYAGAAVLVLIAFALALWGMKAAGLLKPR